MNFPQEIKGENALETSDRFCFGKMFGGFFLKAPEILQSACPGNPFYRGIWADFEFYS
jgi:hypothetical protein